MKNESGTDKESLLVSEEDFVWDKKNKGVGFKSALIEYAALKRGFSLTRLSNRLIVIEPESGTKLGFSQLNGNLSSKSGKMLCDNKQYTRSLLKKVGMSVVESRVFNYESYDKAVSYVKKIGFPIVVKPTNLARGVGITVNINNFDDFKNAWKKAASAYPKRRRSRKMLVERFVIGEDYRVYVVGDRVVSVSQRKRANVIGDGNSTILELIKIKNKERKKIHTSQIF